MSPHMRRIMSGVKLKKDLNTMLLHTSFSNGRCR